MARTLKEWLRWQQSLHPREIDLGLDRCREVAARLEIALPHGRVFTIAGTNGKGSTAGYIHALLGQAGWRTGLYSSPHLVRYNERIRIEGCAVSDEDLVAAFEAVASARGEVPLTYFEFGTLSAFWLFSQARLDAWILEVGLGGRLDAVNIVDADFSLITTVDLDHQDWLGSTVEEIAAEKAGILRAGRPGFYGGDAAPASLLACASRIGAHLHLAGIDFGFRLSARGWEWWSGASRIGDLPLPSPGDAAQLANLSIAAAAVAACEPDFVRAGSLAHAAATGAPAGRFQQITHAGCDWLLDVAHNPQAAELLASRLRGLPPAVGTTFVFGLHANKDLDAILAPLTAPGQLWICCRAGDTAGREPADLAGRLAAMGIANARSCETPEEAVELAIKLSPPAARVVVFGSFEVVGPALAAIGAAPE